MRMRQIDARVGIVAAPQMRSQVLGFLHFGLLVLVILIDLIDGAHFAVHT